jgi:basic membrane protein A
VFTTSFGYMDPTLAVAGEFPDVYFEHASGYKSSENMGNYFGAMEEARYLSGMAAAGVTESNVLGYVAAFPIPEVIRGINAFTLGARAVNPDVTVKVVWTSTWYDPAKERAAAESLLDAGADVLAQHEDSPATGQAAEERGAYWVGYDSDMRRFAEGAFLTAPVWDWGPYYVSRVQAVLDGTWETDSYYGTMADGMIQLAPMSDLVPSDVQGLVTEAAGQIEAGELAVLAGPIADQTGEIRIAEGETMALADALAWDWFVEGVEGDIPALTSEGGDESGPAPAGPSRAIRRGARCSRSCGCRGSSSASPASWPATASTWRSARARCTRSSARTAPARPR